MSYYGVHRRRRRHECTFLSLYSNRTEKFRNNDAPNVKPAQINIGTSYSTQGARVRCRSVVIIIIVHKYVSRVFIVVTTSSLAYMVTPLCIH